MRKPAVSGFFYPDSASGIRTMLDSFLSASEEDGMPGRIIGIIVPHAGYAYSGKTAMAAYSLLKNEERRSMIIMGPNHSGYPRKVSVYSNDSWETPMGSAKVMKDAATRLFRESTLIIHDNDSHRQEHSVEVQLPFLQYFFLDQFSFLPVILGDQSQEIAVHLSGQISGLMENAILIASSDLTHYEPQEKVMEKDMELIKVIESLDVDRFYSTLYSRNISACGYGAIATLMYITRQKGGKIILLSHSTSGDTAGDYSSVVGYAAMAAYIE